MVAMTSSAGRPTNEPRHRGRPTSSTRVWLRLQGHSPLGDPVPFSAYLIGQLSNPTGYSTQFNLDADRAYAYLTWDWIRGDQPRITDLGFRYDKPEVPPWLGPVR